AYELLLKFGTGQDDLRGGNDNVDVLVNLRDGSQQRFRNVNLGGRWISNYRETVRIVLTKPVKPSLIKDLVVSTTFRGGIAGDNWDMTYVKIRALGGDVDEPRIAWHGAHRFTGDDKQIVVPVTESAPLPPGTVDSLEMIFHT